MQPDFDTIRDTVRTLLGRLEDHPGTAERHAYLRPADHGVSLEPAEAAAFEAVLRERLRLVQDRGEAYFLIGGCRLLAGDPAFAVLAFHLSAAEPPTAADGLRWVAHLHFGFNCILPAQRRYRLALSLQPDDPGLLRHLSCVLYPTDRTVATTLLARALRVNPAYLEAHRNLARCALAGNRAADAITRYQRVIALDPRHAEAWRNLGNAVFALRRMDDVETFFGRAVRLDPMSVPARTSMADVLLLKGAADEAGRHHRAVVDIRGSMPSVQFLPDALAELRSDLSGAAVELRSMLESFPESTGPRERHGIASMLRAHARGLAGDDEGCLADLRLAEARLPGNAWIRLDRWLAGVVADRDFAGNDGIAAAFAADEPGGLAWLDSLLNAGIPMECCVLGHQWHRSVRERKAVWTRVRPALEEALTGLAAGDRRYGLALAAVSFAPDGPGVWCDHLRAWARQFGTFDRRAALDALVQVWRMIHGLGEDGIRQSRAIADIVFENETLLLCSWLEAMHLVGMQAGCADDWMAAMFARTPRLLEILDGRPDVDDLLPHVLLAACFLSRDDADYSRIAAFWIGRLRRWEHWRRFADRSPAVPADGRIRVGYVVHDFRHQDYCPEHNVLRFHDTARFDVTVYFTSPRHSPWCRRLEGVPPLLRDFPGRVRDINGLAPEESAALIARDGVGVLFDTFGWWAEEIPQIFAQRPAPLQATWCGLSRPGKDAIMDYIVANDDLLPHGTDEAIPERIIRVDGSYIPVKPRTHVPRSLSRSLLGIPENRFVFVGYHQVMKINGQTLDLWMEIMRRCPDSVLILNRMDPDLVWRLSRRHGVDPGRILFFRFVKTEVEHLMRLGVADLFLDTTPFTSAGLTGVDAIYMGVPRITLTQANLYSRFGMVLMNAVGLGDFVCCSRDAFIARAVQLYNERDALCAAKRRLATEVARSDALDPAGVLRKIERAIETMWARHCAGLPPRSFRV